MRTREVADICEVTVECIRQNAKEVGMDFGYEEFKNHDWTEDELKRVQKQLMRNSTNAGTGSTVVKQQFQSALELGALTIAIFTIGPWFLFFLVLFFNLIRLFTINENKVVDKKESKKESKKEKKSEMRTTCSGN